MGRCASGFGQVETNKPGAPLHSLPLNHLMQTPPSPVRSPTSPPHPPPRQMARRRLEKVGLGLGQRVGRVGAAYAFPRHCGVQALRLPLLGLDKNAQLAQVSLEPFQSNRLFLSRSWRLAKLRRAPDSAETCPCSKPRRWQELQSLN